MKEHYDGNKIRMVLGTRKGPFGWDPGFYDGGRGRYAEGDGRYGGGSGVVCCVIQ
jgi:hypothetical protein